MKNKAIRETCKSCNRLLPTKKLEKLDSVDTNKMRRIMKKYKLTQLEVANIINRTQSCVSAWFTKERNTSGIIKPKYFQILKSKGYK